MYNLLPNLLTRHTSLRICVVGTGETAEQVKLAHDFLHSGGRAVSERILFVCNPLPPLLQAMLY